MNSIILIAKVTHSCNLRCRYCFYTKSLNDHFPTTLSKEDLRTILRKTSEYWDKVSLVFHGGEPLLLPLEYFQAIIDFQRQLYEEHGTEFRNSIQTNGTVYTNELCTFLKNADIHIGISLDGTRETHDKNRPFKDSDKHSFDLIIENTYKFKQSGLNPSALVVATKQVVKDARSIYDFYKTHKLDFKINELFSDRTEPDIIPTPTELASFYEKLFDLWFYDTTEPILRIRPFTSMLASFWSTKVGDCTYRSNCSKFMVLETDGSIFSCARFSYNTEFRLGNILYESWPKILSSPVIDRLERRRDNLPVSCRKCEWLEQCWGGCAACALKDKGNLFDKTHWCASRKHIFDHIKNRLIYAMKGAV